MNELPTSTKIAEIAGRGFDTRDIGARDRPTDVSRIARVEGWSVADLGRASTEATSRNGRETVPLTDSRGDVATWVSEGEKAIYDHEGLHPENIAGRECLVRDDIDWRQKDAFGQTNLERARHGLAPLDANRQEYQLHHVQQKNHGQLAEMSCNAHQGKGSEVLHDNHGPSEINRHAFAHVRADHWRARAEAIDAAHGHDPHALRGHAHHSGRDVHRGDAVHDAHGSHHGHHGHHSHHGLSAHSGRHEGHEGHPGGHGHGGHGAHGSQGVHAGDARGEGPHGTGRTGTHGGAGGGRGSHGGSSTHGGGGHGGAGGHGGGGGGHGGGGGGGGHR